MVAVGEMTTPSRLRSGVHNSAGTIAGKTKTENAYMQLTARDVLSDCEIALEILEDTEDVRRWRVLWSGAVALARTVGHVLRHVDRKEPQFRAAIDQRFEFWKSERDANAVFWDFIEEERNNLLKEYKSRVSDAEEIPLGILPSTEDLDSEETFLLGENLYRPILSGYGEGEDARDIYKEALDWWERELSAIEAISAGTPP
jgi:hypothetical protein